MRNYEQKKMSRYTLGFNKYMETCYYIRQYDDNKKVLQQLLESIDSISVEMDGQPRSGNIGKPTEVKAIHIADLKKRINDVESALQMIPKEYRETIMSHIKRECYYGQPAFDYANINTWKKWQQRFVCQVAMNKGEGDYVSLIKESIGKKTR